MTFLKKIVRKSAFVLFPCELASLLSCSQKLTKQRQRMKGKQMAECVCFLVVGNLPCSSGLFFSLIFIYLLLRSLLSCMPRLSLLLGKAALCCLHRGIAEACPLPFHCRLSPSEQLQTPSNIVHHLLLTHYGQDSAGTSLHLPKTRTVGLLLLFYNIFRL